METSPIEEPDLLDRLMSEYAADVRAHQRRMAAVSAGPVCDFCCAAPALTSFPRRKAMVEVLVMPGGDQVVRIDEEPWAACLDCTPLVLRRQLHLLIERALTRHPEYFGWNRPQRREGRARYKRVFQDLFKAGLDRPQPIDPSMPPIPEQVLKVTACPHPEGSCPPGCQGFELIDA